MENLNHLLPSATRPVTLSVVGMSVDHYCFVKGIDFEEIDPVPIHDFLDKIDELVADRKRYAAFKDHQREKRHENWWANSTKIVRKQLGE